MSVAFVPPLMCSCCSEKITVRRQNVRVPVGITDPRVRAVVAQVLLSTGIRSSHIFSPLRSREVSIARALIAYRLRYEMRYSLQAIADFLGRDHSSVSAMLVKIQRME